MADSGLGFLGAALSGFGGGSVGGAVVHLLLDTKQFDAGLKSSEAKLTGASTSMGSRLKTLGPAMAAVGAAAAIGIGVKAVQAFNESEQAIAQTNAVLKSTGGIAGVTGAQVTNFAERMQQLTTFSDEEVRSAENLLLTFTKIGKDVFPETTQAVLDMSTALGQDLKSSSIQLGKALNDPVKGVTALQRVGVALTAEQRDQIATMVEQNDLLGAQKVILGEVATEFGGSAKAAAKTFGGQLKILANQFNDVLEVLGKFVVSIGRQLIPVIKSIVPVLQFAAYNANLLLIAFAGFATVKWILPFLDAMAVKMAALGGASLTAQVGISRVFLGFGRVVPVVTGAVAGLAVAHKKLDSEAARAAAQLRKNITYLIANRDAGQSWQSTLDEMASTGGRVSEQIAGVGAATRQFTQELAHGTIGQDQFNAALQHFAQNDDPKRAAELLTTVLNSLNGQMRLGVISAPEYRSALIALGLTPKEVAGQFDNLRVHVNQAGRTIRNFAGMTGAELKDFRGSARTSLNFVEASFEDLIGASHKSATGILRNLRRALKAQEGFAENSSRFLGEVRKDFGPKMQAAAEQMVAILAQSGQDGADEMKALAGASDDQIAQILQTFRKGREGANRMVDRIANIASAVNNLPSSKTINIRLNVTATGSGSTASDKNIAKALASELIRAQTP